MTDRLSQNPDIPPPKLADELYALKKKRDQEQKPIQKRDADYMGFIREYIR